MIRKIAAVIMSPLALAGTLLGLTGLGLMLSYLHITATKEQRLATEKKLLLNDLIRLAQKESSNG